MSFNLSNYQGQLRESGRNVYQTIFLNDEIRHRWTKEDISKDKVCGFCRCKQLVCNSATGATQRGARVQGSLQVLMSRLLLALKNQLSFGFSPLLFFYDLRTGCDGEVVAANVAHMAPFLVCGSLGSLPSRPAGNLMQSQQMSVEARPGGGVGFNVLCGLGKMTPLVLTLWYCSSEFVERVSLLRSHPRAIAPSPFL